MLLLPQVKDTVGRKQLEFQRGWRQGLGFSDPDYILTLEQQTVLFCWLVLLSRAPPPPPVRLLLQQDHCFCLLRVISLCTCISALCNPCFPLQCHGWPAQLLEWLGCCIPSVHLHFHHLWWCRAGSLKPNPLFWRGSWRPGPFQLVDQPPANQGSSEKPLRCWLESVRSQTLADVISQMFLSSIWLFIFYFFLVF